MVSPLFIFHLLSIIQLYSHNFMMLPGFGSFKPHTVRHTRSPASTTTVEGRDGMYWFGLATLA